MLAENLSINNGLRLLAGAMAASTIAIITLTGVSDVNAMRTLARMDQVLDVKAAAMTLEKDFTSLERDVFRAAANPTVETIAAAARNRSDFEQSVRSADEKIENPVRQRLIQKVGLMEQRYSKRFDDFINRLEADDRAGALQVIHDLDQIGQGIDSTIEEIRESSSMEARNASVSQESAARLSLFLSLAVGLVTLAIGFLISTWVSRAIRRPVAAVTAALRQIADQRYETDIAATARTDEVGELARAAVTLRERGREMQRLETGRVEVVEELGRSLSSLAKGDLTACVAKPFPPEFAKLRDDFNSATDRLREVMVLVAARVQNVRSASFEIENASADLASRTMRQAASLQETAAAVEELSGTARTTAVNVRAVAGGAGATQKAAEQGTQVAAEAASAMTKIATSSREISTFVSLIDEIAFQTNLLALNAGVEAARAGDGGRGFAVVANEVRNLAQRSAEAARSIKSIVLTSTEQVDQGVALVGRSAAALEAIVTEAVKVSQLAAEITSAVQQQSAGVGQIASAVSSMDTATQQNASMVEESNAACASLAQEAQELEAAIAAFEIEDKRCGRPDPSFGSGAKRVNRRGRPSIGNAALKAVDEDWPSS